MGPRNAVLGVADACGHLHWSRRWSFLWGHEALYWALEPYVEFPMGPRNAVLGMADACGQWGL
eukprot:7974364-Pyramimonas_sp.AAC.1